MLPKSLIAAGAFALAAPAAALAQDEAVKVYFQTGSAHIAADQTAALDTAARLFREGAPYVMIVSGGADTVGAPVANLDLSVRRAAAVVEGLVDRGIPVERLQIVGRGNSELEVQTAGNVPEPENRVVEITWR